MKLMNLKKIQSTPIAYFIFTGAVAIIFTWLFNNAIAFEQEVTKNSSLMLFWLLGASAGVTIGYRSTIKRMEIGATFFALIGTGIMSLILQTHHEILPITLFGFYSSWLLTTTTQWIRKNKKISFGKWTTLILTGITIAVSTTFGAESISLSMKISGIGAICMAILTLKIIPGQIARYMVVVAARLIFRLKITSHNNIPKHGGALLVSNHVSFLDFIILTGSIQRNIRFVMHQGIFNNKFLKPILKKLNMIPISPRGGKNNLAKFNKRCQQEINNGHVVVIFAEGTVTRNGQILPFKKGVEYIAKGIKSPIIPINLEGVLGTPLSFTQENSEVIRPTIKNIYKKIFITVGKPLASNTSVFIVRQKIIEMGAKSFNNRVDRKATLGKWILNINNKKQLIQDVDGNWKNGKTIKEKSLVLSSRLKKALKDDNKVALLHKNDFNFNLFTYALSLLGKEIIVLNPEKCIAENRIILKQLKVQVCINGIGKELNPCQKYISAKGIMEKPTFGEIFSSKLLAQLPAVFVLKFLNNSQSKYSNVITFTHIREKLTHGVSMTNSMILAKSKALNQIHLTKHYGKVLSLHSLFTTLGFYLDILLPVTQQIQTTKSDFSVANTIIGLVTDVERVIDRIKNNNNIKRIFMDNQTISENLQNKLKDIECFQGFGSINLSPIIAVNTPDYIGKDIVGIPLVQEGNKPKTVGRPIPSIAIKIVKDTVELGINEWGRIWIKGTTISKQFVIDPCGNIINDYLDWIDTKVTGMIDDKGFLSVHS